MIHIFTDGSSRGNPGPGGWALLYVDYAKEAVIERGGHNEHTTNNRMELSAIIEGLRVAHTADAKQITCYTDSSYAIQGAEKWMHGWKKNGWRTKTGDDVLNQDLWKELDVFLSMVRVSFVHVRGHRGIPGNERVDTIANTFASGESVSLFEGSLSTYFISKDALMKIDVATSVSKGKAFSYLSLVDKKVQRHSSWADCEKRVKGIRGARFCKTFSSEHEKEILETWKTL